MNIVLLIDAEALEDDDPQFRGRTPSVRQATEFHVLRALRRLGHDVEILPFGPDVRETLRALARARPRLVFNLTEHFGGDRRKDAWIASRLERLDLPCTGSGPAALKLCRDKARCKRLLVRRGIRVPDFAVLGPGQGRTPAVPPFPVIVKPLYEDGSDGIALGSLVHNASELKARVKLVHRRWKQPALCEEYIEGREISVGVIGNERLRALPAREARFGSARDGGPAFATSRVKRSPAYRRKWRVAYGHAGLTPRLERDAGRLAKRIYRLLGIRDYGRIDFRLTPDNELVFLEANPNPDLGAGDELAWSARRTGLRYDRLVQHVVAFALRRRA